MKKVNEITVKQLYDVAYDEAKPFGSWKNGGYFAITNMLAYLLKKQLEDSDQIGIIDIYAYMLCKRGLGLDDVLFCSEKLVKPKNEESFDIRLYKTVCQDRLFDSTRKAFEKLPAYVLKQLGLEQAEYDSGEPVNSLSCELQERLMLCTSVFIFFRVFEESNNMLGITDLTARQETKDFLEGFWNIRKTPEKDRELIAKWVKKLGITIDDVKLARNSLILETKPDAVFMLKEYLTAEQEATYSIKTDGKGVDFSPIQLKSLDKKVVGQEHAMFKIKSRLLSASLGFRQEHQPIASFLLTGPTGVGKTETAKAVADACFDGKIYVVDMSTFKNEIDVSRLTGGSPNYVGYNDKNNFCDFVRENPNCVILFDEIEKAHQGCVDLIMRILDEGQFINAKGETISFENTVIFCTTNYTQNKSAKIGFGGQEETTEETVAGGEGFKKEVVGRFSEVIEYRPLERDDSKKIARKFLDAVIASFEKNNQSGIKLTYTDDLVEAIVVKANTKLLGARDLKKAIQSEFINAVVAYVQTHKCAGATLVVSASGVRRATKAKIEQKTTADSQGTK